MAQDRLPASPEDDELLEKLDQLINRHRQIDGLAPTSQSAAPPVDDIPTLTDAVAGPNLTRREPAARPEELVENRLTGALSREIARLQQELPAHAAQLAALGATMKAAIKWISRRHLEKAPEPRK
ncbi:MAG TPA: hypothetical protein VNM24_01435 [Burkholderiales bacterium]|nr:hypothetical protein [Burkholderiales bacterium]